MSNQDVLKDAVDQLLILSEDNTVPKNVRSKIQEIILGLDNNDDSSLKRNKALHLLEEVADDVNVQSYTRTQIWNVVSTLEKT